MNPFLKERRAVCEKFGCNALVAAPIGLCLKESKTCTPDIFWIWLCGTCNKRCRGLTLAAMLRYLNEPYPYQNTLIPGL